MMSENKCYSLKYVLYNMSGVGDSGAALLGIIPKICIPYMSFVNLKCMKANNCVCRE